MNSRRDAIKTLGLSTLTLLTASGVQAQGTQQQTKELIGSAFGTDAVVKPLNFDPLQLDGISEKVITSHWENNYAGSVRALNTIKSRLSAALEDDSIPAFLYNDMKREHLMRTGSVILHELYFDNLAAPGNSNSEFDSALVKAFGSVSVWKKEFIRIASGLGGGSGWVMLAWNHHLGLLENYWMADHLHCPVYASPILVLDMYEHSYHMDYGTATRQYIDAFMRNVNWEILAQRLDKARLQITA